jgi:beta-lactamase regulating signal transducer with metallopeptidase domain
VNTFIRFADGALPAALAHLWSSTIFLALMLLLIALLRRRLTAGAIFSIALIGLLKFAIPSMALAKVVEWAGGDARVPETNLLSAPLTMLSGTFPAAEAAGVRTWPALLLGAWAFVALILIVRATVVRHRLVSLATKTALPVTSREIEALRKAKSRAGVGRSIDVARSALPEAPAVLRTLRPLIVLPVNGCEELTDEELESLLCHECAHVARYDNLIARFESWICALFWFHPLIWIAQRITVVERERACDEVVSGSADERDTYLTALRKFCHAAIAPRLPGVSCMATAKLKERIDHVMSYADLKERAPGEKKVTLFAAGLLALFTVASGVVSETAIAKETAKKSDRYSVLVTAQRVGDGIVMKGNVSDRKTSMVLSAPTITIALGQQSIARSAAEGIDVVFDARSAGSKLLVDVTVSKDGKVVQSDDFSITPEEEKPATRKYTGEPIDLTLQDADIRDLIRVFGQLTGLEMQVDDDVTGRVSVNWKNVPWDEAFDSMLKENGLTYKLEGSKMHVSKR